MVKVVKLIINFFCLNTQFSTIAHNFLTLMKYFTQNNSTKIKIMRVEFDPKRLQVTTVWRKKCKIGHPKKCDVLNIKKKKSKGIVFFKQSQTSPLLLSYPQCFLIISLLTPLFLCFFFFLSFRSFPESQKPLLFIRRFSDWIQD